MVGGTNSCKHKMYCRHTLQSVGEYVHANAMLQESFHFEEWSVLVLKSEAFLSKCRVMERKCVVGRVQAVLYELCRAKTYQ